MADATFKVDGLTVGTAAIGGEPEFTFAAGVLLHDADLGEQLTRTASGTVATAATAYAGAALRSVAVEGRSVQDGTPTPSSPVAIESVEDVAVAVSGKNLLDMPEMSLTRENVYYIELTVNSGSFNQVELTAGTTYTLSLDVECSAEPFKLSVGVGSGRYSADIFNTNTAISSGRVSVTFTPTEAQLANGNVFALRVPRFGSKTTFTVTLSDVQLELGSTATPYTPYVGTSAPLDLDGHALRSLPDGTCDEAVWTAEGGTLTQRVGSVTFDGSESWRFALGNPSYGYVNLPDAKASQSAATLLCSHCPANGSVGIAQGKCIIGGTGNAIFAIPDGLGITTAAAWNQWVSAAGLTISYELAEPATYALPTSPLPDAPAADMAVWADCEPSTEVEVEYRESIQLAVDEIREAIASIV